MLDIINKMCEINNEGIEMVKIQEITALASTLTVLGIVFGSADRLIGYSFIGAGILLSILSMIRAKKESMDRRVTP